MLSHQISNVTNNWMYIPVHVYYLHDLQKKQLSLHKSCMCCQACLYLIYRTYNLVNPLIRNFIKSCFTIDNVPNQINRLVGFHSDFSILGTKPLLIKSHSTWFTTALQGSSFCSIPNPSSRYIITCLPSDRHFFYFFLLFFFLFIIFKQAL